MVKFNFKLPKYFNEYKDYINNYYNLNATNEIWKVIQENTDYEISNYGRVRSKNNGLLKPMLNNKGYLRVTIFVWEYGSRKDRFIHRLVAEYFCTNPDKINYNIVDHIDGNIFNNHYSNIRWCDVNINTNNPNTKNRIVEGIYKSTKGNFNKVYMIDDNNNIINEYRSAKQATESIGCSRTYMTHYLNKTILKNQKGVRYTIKHVKGHQFCYAKDYIKPN